MDYDVQRVLTEVGLDAATETFDAEVAVVLVAFVVSDFLRRVGDRIVGGVQWIDLLEVEQFAVGHFARLVHLPALEESQADVERARPGAARTARARCSP